MATWKDINRLVDRMGGNHVSATMDQIVVPGCEQNRKQQVYLAYELTPPDFEFVKVMSAFAMVDLVNVEAVVRRVGRLQVGCVSYQYIYENGKEVDGFVTLAASIPLVSVNLPSEEENFGLYLHLLGKAADTLEKEFAEPGRRDFF